MCTGGALNTSLSANSFFDMVFEPPFVDSFIVHKRVYHRLCDTSRKPLFGCNDFSRLIKKKRMCSPAVFAGKTLLPADR